MLTAVTGINWGDEGKGRVIDLLAEQADIVVRYQGGNNAGHTVVVGRDKYVLNRGAARKRYSYHTRKSKAFQACHNLYALAPGAG